MAYIYSLTNTKNGKKFLGKSNLDKNLLKKLLFRALRKKIHYNDLLQKDFKKYRFEFRFEESEDVLKDFDDTIRSENLLDPRYGYNLFNDLSNIRGQKKKVNLFSEDLCLLFLFNRKVQFIATILGMERNTISNRLSNFGLFQDGYFKYRVTRYEDFYFRAMRILYLEEQCYTASILMNKMTHKYDISTQLRINPRKISKFFAAHHVKKLEGKTHYGSVLYCSGVREDVN